MAGGNTDYIRGSMEVEAQSGAFSGFMGGTKYGGSAIALLTTLLVGLGALIVSLAA